MPVKLDPENINAAMASLNNWVLAEDGQSIFADFKFNDFSEAWAMMNRIALLAEKMDHHPEWSNVYNTITIRLTTHDVGGLSDLDFTMAKAIEALLET